jgi:hypothetical protein
VVELLLDGKVDLALAVPDTLPRSTIRRKISFPPGER